MMRPIQTLFIVFSLFLISCNNNEAYFIFSNSELQSSINQDDPNPLFHMRNSKIESNYNIKINNSTVLDSKDLLSSNQSYVKFYEFQNFFLDKPSPFKWNPQGIFLAFDQDHNIKINFSKQVSLGSSDINNKNFVYSIFIKSTHTFGVWLQISTNSITGSKTTYGCGFDSKDGKLSHATGDPDKDDFKRNEAEKIGDSNWYRISCYGPTVANIFTADVLLQLYNYENSLSPIYSTGYQLELTSSERNAPSDLGNSATNLMQP